MDIRARHRAGETVAALAEKSVCGQADTILSHHRNIRLFYCKIISIILGTPS
jgi:hypothetical protein